MLEFLGSGLIKNGMQCQRFEENAKAQRLRPFDVSPILQPRHLDDARLLSIVGS